MRISRSHQLPSPPLPYALAKMEDQRIDHQTGNYFSYNGSVPSAAEAQRLAVGGWPADRGC